MAAEKLAQVQWIWEGASQLAEDNYVNNFHFQYTGVAPNDYDNIRDMLVDYYTIEAPGASNAISSFMCTPSVTGTWTIKIYLLDDPKPRYPVYTDTGFVGLSGGTTLPAELALVMSFQGMRIAGEVQSRRRNRIYLGPFILDANDDGLVTGALVETVLFAGKELLNASIGADKWDWVVYSPTNDDVVVIDNGWVDNAWDIQRRRGIRSTARGTFGATYPE